jgi:hypothetical protein
MRREGAHTCPRPGGASAYGQSRPSCMRASRAVSISDSLSADTGAAAVPAPQTSDMQSAEELAHAAAALSAGGPA